MSAYQKPDYQLKYSAKDTHDLADLLSKGGPLYRGVETKVLTDAGADKDESNGNYYYLPVNADIDKLASAGNGAIVFSSSTGTQHSYEDPTWASASRPTAWTPCSRAVSSTRARRCRHASSSPTWRTASS